MKKKSAAFWTRRSLGLTLIETLAGSALLGTLLVAILLAGARMKIQANSAELRLRACEIADELLETFWARKEGIPQGDSGGIEGHEGWHWRTQLVENEESAKMDADVVALEVYAPGSKGPSPTVSVEVLVARKNYAAPARVHAD